MDAALHHLPAEEAQPQQAAAQPHQEAELQVGELQRGGTGSNLRESAYYQNFANQSYHGKYVGNYTYNSPASMFGTWLCHKSSLT